MTQEPVLLKYIGPDPVTQGSGQAIPGPRHLLHQDVVRRPPTVMSAKEAGVFPLNPLPQAWSIWDTERTLEFCLLHSHSKVPPFLTRLKGLPEIPSSLVVAWFVEKGKSHEKKKAKP